MFKKISAALLSFAAFAVMSAVSVSAEASIGDVDNSGTIDIKDATKIINHINGVKSLTSSEMTQADADMNEKVDIEDFTRIINHINGVKPIGTSMGERLRKLCSKYAGNFSVEMIYSFSPKERLELVYNGENFYERDLHEDGHAICEVRAVDGMTYMLNTQNKIYTSQRSIPQPEIKAFLGGYTDELIKTVTDGNTVSEYYIAKDECFICGGELVYNFDKNTSVLKSIDMRPYDTERDIVGTMFIVSLGPADDSKFAVPDLSGYTKAETLYP